MDSSLPGIHAELAGNIVRNDASADSPALQQKYPLERNGLFDAADLDDSHTIQRLGIC